MSRSTTLRQNAKYFFIFKCNGMRRACSILVLALLAAWMETAALAQSVTPLPSWTQQFPATSPSPRYGAAMAYDASTDQLVLFGGATFGLTSAMLGIAFAIIVFSGLTACGGGGSGSCGTGSPTTNSGTTAGTYTFTISGVGNDPAKTAATTAFTLTVN